MGSIQDKIKHHRWQIEYRRKKKNYKPKPNKSFRNHQGHLCETVRMPERLDIYDSTQAINETLATLSRLERHLVSDFHLITLDFSQTKIIKAAAILILFSIIDRLIHEKSKEIKIILRINHDEQAIKTRSILTKSGLLSLCNRRGYQNIFNLPHLPIISSSGGKYREQIVDFIAAKIYKSMPPELEYIYSDAIQEAINNVTAHAYLSLPETTPRKWWLLCELLNDQLYLVIYDSGVGIPNTFNINYDFSNLEWDNETTQQHFKQIYSENISWLASEYPSFETFLESVKQNKTSVNELPDHLKIYMAMHGDMTRKEEDKHGQGSKSIKALVSNNSSGVLWIFSGNGRMKFREEASRPILDGIPNKLTGTLIQWNIRVAL